MSRPGEEDAGPEPVVPAQGGRAERPWPPRALELPGPPQPVPPWGPVPPHGTTPSPAPTPVPPAGTPRGSVPAPPAAPSAPAPYGSVPAEPRPDFDHRDPSAYYRALRERYGPVAPVLLHQQVPAWLVLGYHEVHRVAGHPELFSRDPRHWHSWDRVPPDWPLLADVAPTPSVRFTEGAEHRRRAGAIADVLAAVDPFELRRRAEQAADAAVDRFARAGRAELMAEYAEPVPLQVMAGLLGLGEHEAAGLARGTAVGPQQRTSRPPDDAYVPDPDTGGHRSGGRGGRARPLEADAAAARVRGAVQALVARSRQARERSGTARPAPGADLTTLLLAHPADLTDEEIVHDLLTLLAAGRRPTADWIGNTLRLMLTDERFALSLSGGRRSAGQALTEVLWTEPPTQNIIGRWAVRDTELGGQRIARGDCLVLSLAAANADPRVAPAVGGTGARFPGTLGNQAHLAFSHGPHRCPEPAAALAGVIATAAVEVLLDRLPDLALPPGAAEPRWRPSLWQRGPAALPVVFTPV